MHSLYWRIFLAFWVALALILIGTVTVAVNATTHRTERPWIQRGQMYGQAARAFEAGGVDALRGWLQGLPAEPFARTFIIDPDGREMLARTLPPLLLHPAEAAPAGAPGTVAPAAGVIAPVGGALVLVAPGGSTYHVVVGPVRDSPRLFGELELPGVPLALLLIALGVSAAVCLVLARYLAAPVDRLRMVTRRLAGGDLNVQVLPSLKGRKDDMGLLAADLDVMAERLRQLLEAKQQLLRDVSHELRSPLARLQLALTLARRDVSASERHLGRIAFEADRLEQLIARTLTLVRLERLVPELERSSVDVGELLRTIGSDIAIEADAQGCLLDVQGSGELAVSGDVELLRSAFENVIRNAVRYSPPGGLVGISAAHVVGAGREQRIEVTVRDQGPGVPEKDLGLIFEPFYRVDAAREHRSAGGEGLGLAIASRAIALHGGSIEAANAAGGGLRVLISLPAGVRERAGRLRSAAAAA
ncbi:MAG TPA: ATP-binding protein [Steroidobacteraceae bacterium]|jgi:two-component system sensor histidine kinase CpxA|nr:ATP-binding protein [Steroidobacteraceae bacterium]